MPPDKARELARKVFTAVAEGRDPAAEKEENRTAPTVQELSERYQREHAVPFKKKRSAERDDANWRIHILPVLGKKKVKHLTQETITSLHGPPPKQTAPAHHTPPLPP